MLILILVIATNLNLKLLGSACARLAQSVEHETLNLRVVGSSPTLGVALFCYLWFKTLSVGTALHCVCVF